MTRVAERIARHMKEALENVAGHAMGYDFVVSCEQDENDPALVHCVLRVPEFVSWGVEYR